MPREQSLRIDDRPATETHGIQVGTQVVASPVDTYSDQGMQQKMARLGNFLKAGQGLLDTYQKGEEAQGVQDASLGKTQQKSTLLGAYESGWLKMRATVAGTEDAAKVQAQFEGGGFNRDDPQGLDGWLNKQQQALTKNMQPGPYAEAYTARLAEGFNGIREAHIKQVQQDIVGKSHADTVTLLGGIINGAQKNGTPVTPELFKGFRDTLAQQGMGFDDSTFSTLGLKALTAAAVDGNVQAIQGARKEAADGSRAFPTLTDEHYAALEQQAQTVYLHKDTLVREKLKREYETNVNTALYPILKQALNGDVSAAQSAFIKLSTNTDLFKSKPEDLVKYQKMILDMSDKAATLDQREAFNKLYLDIWQDRAGPAHITAADITEKQRMELTTVYMDRWKQQQSNAAANAQAGALNNLLKNQGTQQDIAAAVASLPDLDPQTKSYDHEKTNLVRGIKADIHRRLVKAAEDANGDPGKFAQTLRHVTELGTDHLNAVITGGGKGAKVDNRPTNVHHQSWEAFKADYDAGRIDRDPLSVMAARAYFFPSKTTGGGSR